jgi:AraC family transcriptional regulator, glycine betaine-responsive activator
MGRPFPELRPACAVAEPGWQTFGFLVLDGFSQLAFAAAVETLAAANEALGRAFYDWPIVTPDNGPVRSLAGIALSPDTKICNLPRQAVIVVLGGKTLADERRRKVIADLRREVVHGRRLVGIADGVTLLAEAGALVGSRCAVHWRDAPSFAERFPKLDVRVSAFVRARHSTVSGCMATADFFLDLISSEQGRNVAQTVADQITHRSVRDGTAAQTASQACRIDARNPTILKAVQIMEDNLATPLSAGDLAAQAGISTKFYLRLRLERARDLIANTDKQLDDIADVTGFSSVPILSRHFRRVFGTSPFGKKATTGLTQKHQAQHRSELADFSSPNNSGTAYDPSS